MVTREPGGSPGAEAVRHVLLSGAAEPFGPKMEAVLFAAARSDHVEQVIRPAVERGAIVLCDRFLDSTRVYQGVTGDLDPEFVKALEEVTVNGMVPDMTLILDLDPELGLKRAGARRGEADRRPLREGDARHPPAPARGLSGDRRGGARALHRHRRLRASRRGREGDRGCRVRRARGARHGRRRTCRRLKRCTNASHPEQHDSLDGVPEPSETVRVFGHDAQEAQLTAAHRAGKLPHALVFAGPRGIGKASLAFQLAHYLLSYPSPESAPETFAPRDPASPLYRQVASGAHPSLLHLTRPFNEKTKAFKTVLTVDEMRRVGRFLSLTAHDGGYRVVIVDPADDMNINAANALLKNLEEPPSRTRFHPDRPFARAAAADDPLALPDRAPAAARRSRTCWRHLRRSARRRSRRSATQCFRAPPAACERRSCSPTMAASR